jgi:hypothetical protein
VVGTVTRRHRLAPGSERDQACRLCSRPRATSTDSRTVSRNPLSDRAPFPSSPLQWGRSARLSSDDGISPPGTGTPRRAQKALIRPITRLVLALPLRSEQDDRCAITRLEAKTRSHSDSALKGTENSRSAASMRVSWAVGAFSRCVLSG